MNESGSNDSGQEPTNGVDPAEPPRPEIDPALLRQVDSTAGAPDGDESAPWDVVAEMLESVSDGAEDGVGAEDATNAGPSDHEEAASEENCSEEDCSDEPSGTPLFGVASDLARPDAIPLAAVAEDVAPPESDDGAVTSESQADDDETLTALRAIPLRERVEALLFATTEPLSLVRLRALTAADDPLELRRELDGLADGYRATGSALVLTEVGGGFVLRTRPELSPAVARLGKRRDQERLSSAALETLAIVAYRQPVLRADVEKIRGVASGEVLRTLTEKGLARVAGRADVPGNPLLYGTTQRFLELFGLRNLRDLPSDEQLLRRPGASS